MRGDYSQKTPAVVIELGKFSWFFWSLMGGGRQREDWSHMEVWLNKNCLLHVSLMKYTRFCNCCCQWNWPWCLRKMMSLLCTAQTVWNKGLKKHWFPIVATYGTWIMGRWTCLWSGTCNIIIILHHKVTNDLISADLEIIPGGGG